jgi:hypothetical protein
VLITDWVEEKDQSVFFGGEKLAWFIAAELTASPFRMQNRFGKMRLEPELNALARPEAG